AGDATEGQDAPGTPTDPAHTEPAGGAATDASTSVLDLPAEPAADATGAGTQGAAPETPLDRGGEQTAGAGTEPSTGEHGGGSTPRGARPGEDLPVPPAARRSGHLPDDAGGEAAGPTGRGDDSGEGSRRARRGDPAARRARHARRSPVRDARRQQRPLPRGP